MERKQVRVVELQPGEVFMREPREMQPAATPSPSRASKLLTEPNIREQHHQVAATTLPMHILQPYREEDKVPMFLIKMWNILEDPKFQDIIRWDKVPFYTLLFSFIYSFV